KVGVLERRQVVGADEECPYGPQLMEDPVLDSGRVEIFDPRRAAGSSSPTDHSLDHPCMALTKDDECLLERRQPIEHLAGPGQKRKLAITLDEYECCANAAETRPLVFRRVLCQQVRARLGNLAMSA